MISQRLFLLFGSMKTLRWMWEWWMRDEGEIKMQQRAVMSQRAAGGQRETQQPPEKYEDNLCTPGLLPPRLLSWDTCDESAASLTNDFLLISPRWAAADPTELQHIDRLPAGGNISFTAEISRRETWSGLIGTSSRLLTRWHRCFLMCDVQCERSTRPFNKVKTRI